MLSRLRIKDFAIIDEVEIPFGPGLNVVTGETGAGKSIIIEALACVLGDRPNPEAIRTGKPQADIDAIFDAGDSAGRASLLAAYMGAEDGEIIVSRRLLASGKTRSWINGRPCTVGSLRSAAETLIEFDRERFARGRRFDALEIVDAWDDVKIPSLRAAVGEKHAQMVSLQAEMAKLSGDDGEALRLLDSAAFELSEIEAANLKAGEEAELQERRQALANVEVIAQAAESALQALTADEGAEDVVSRACGALSRIAKFDRRFGDIARSLEETQGTLAGISDSLREASEGLDRSPGALDEVVARIDMIARLKRKYGGDIPEILAYAQRLKTEIEGLRDRDNRRAELEAALVPLNAELKGLASRLTDARTLAARSLEREVKSHLTGLGFDRTDFTVEFASKAIDAGGGDTCRFAISLNPGEPMMPLEDVASLGEASRIMLAVRCAFSRCKDFPTVVLDEIDIGIGGMTAHAVARKLKELSELSQVVCVTHLPQVAQVADHHVKVEKTGRQNRTLVSVTPLDAAGRQAELKRMEGKASRNAQAA
jgi:DNA repair protein RecN (Recombination protein N)